MLSNGSAVVENASFLLRSLYLTYEVPRWLYVSKFRLHGFARFPCDSTAFVFCAAEAAEIATCYDEDNEQDDAHDLLAQLEVLAGLEYHLYEECEQEEHVGDDEERFDGVVAVFVTVTVVMLVVVVVVSFPVVVVFPVGAVGKREAVDGNRDGVHVEGERREHQCSLAAIHRDRVPGSVLCAKLMQS